MPRQGCCGALSAHAGQNRGGGAADRAAAPRPRRLRRDRGQRLGLRLAPEGSRPTPHTTSPSSSPSALARGGIRSPLRVAYQDSCHLRHAQALPAAYRPSLSRIPALDVVEPAEQDVCCGSAGIYNLVQPAAARDLGERKARHVLATGAQGAREREPRLPRPARDGAAPGRSSPPGAAPGRAASTRRSGTPAPRACCAARVADVGPARRASALDRPQLVDPVDPGELAEEDAARAPRSRSSATPPSTTAGTSPISAAATPDSNSPSSFDALMKTISTALTRPRSSSGVTNGTIVCAQDDAHHVRAAAQPPARRSRARSRARARRRRSRRRTARRR